MRFCHKDKQGAVCCSVLLLLIITISAVPGSAAAAGIHPGNPAPSAQKGVLDLREWDFEKLGMVRLAGEWEFVRSQHIRPDRLDTKVPPDRKHFLKVPGSWNRFESDTGESGGHGIGTYRLTVLLKADQPPLAVKLLDMATACTVFVNGQKVAQSGVAGETASETLPYYLPQVVDIDPAGSRLTIVAHVSNFHHWQGGMWEPISLGSRETVRQARENRIIIDFLLFGGIFIMGFYHLSLFGLRPKEQSYLFFGLFCLCIAVRVLLTGERYAVRLLPGMSYESLMKTVYICFYLCVPLFSLFMQRMFPKEMSNRIVTGILCAGAAFSMFTLFTPSRLYTAGMPLFQAATVVGLLWGTTVIIRSVRKKRQGARFFAVGFGILFVFILNDILYTRQMITTGHFVSVGLCIFIFIQSFLISRKVSSAMSLVEAQHKALEERNAAYEQELEKRKQIQTELEQSGKRLRRILEQSSDGVTIVQDMKICFVNTAFADMASRQKQDLIGTSFLDLVHPDDRQTVLNRYSKRISGAVPRERYTIRGMSLDKEVREIELSASLTTWHGQPAVLVFLRDVTQQKKTEELLIQSEKMMSVGGLAAGMAHEINNPLAGMIQSAQVVHNRLSRQIPANVKAAQNAGTDLDAVFAYCRDRNILGSLENIMEAGKNAAQIVKNMLSFARKEDVEKKSHDILEIMDRALDLAANDYNAKRNYDFKQIRIQKEYPQEPVMVECEPVRIRQVFLNILKNAAQAMTDNTAMVRPPHIRIRVGANGPNACIDIKDNGPGMTEETRKRCLEPFFTTKPVGRGTGLGLSVSYFIIKDIHQGDMVVESGPDAGTTFSIQLPLT